jgi:tripartite-type tricarboxylate transporter receptor subunit TctC
MNPPRLWIARALAASLLATAAVATPGLAQTIDKPVRLLVGFPAGGTADLIARVVGDRMKDTLGQPVVVENRPGAIGRIAIEAVKGAAPDGTTIMVQPIGPMVVVPHAYKTVTYDPVKDFAPIAQAVTFQFAYATGPMTGAKTWSEYVAWAKANPQKSSYATSGAGSLPHFFGLMLGKEAGIELLHVPYKGSAAYIGELIGGQIPAAADAVGDLTEQHRAGKIRILATSGTTRALPDVPTFREVGVAKIEAYGWFGFFAPARTPKPIVDQLNRAVVTALKQTDAAEKIRGTGMTPSPTSAEEFAAIVAADYAKWGPPVKASGFTIE